MNPMQLKPSSIPNVVQVFSRARAMPGLRPTTRDVANPQGRDLQRPGHALMALMQAMSNTPEDDKS